MDYNLALSVINAANPQDGQPQTTQQNTQPTTKNGETYGDMNDLKEFSAKMGMYKPSKK